MKLRSVPTTTRGLFLKYFLTSSFFESYDLSLSILFLSRDSSITYAHSCIFLLPFLPILQHLYAQRKALFYGDKNSGSQRNICTQFMSVVHTLLISTYSVSILGSVFLFSRRISIHVSTQLSQIKTSGPA